MRVLIALAALAMGGTARADQPLTKFDLVCEYRNVISEGSPPVNRTETVELMYSIDLDRGVWNVTGRPSPPQRIVRFDATKIVLTEILIDERHWATSEVDRFTGEIIALSANIPEGRAQAGKGTCEKAPFTAFEEPRF